jgi:DNA repair protein SbcD/Mre11
MNLIADNEQMVIVAEVGELLKGLFAPGDSARIMRVAKNEYLALFIANFLQVFEVHLVISILLHLQRIEDHLSSVALWSEAEWVINGWLDDDNATEYTVGGIDSLEISDLGVGYDYLALGHIHHEQWIRGSHHRIRYAGSPMAVSFDENYEHSVSLITIGKHGDEVELKKIAIENPKPLVTLPASENLQGNFTSWDEAKKLLEDFPSDIPAYIRLNVEVEDFLPVAANQEASQLVKDKLCRFCLINTRRKQHSEASQPRTMTVQEFQSEAPIDIARRYAEDCGITFDDELKEMFKEITEQL